MITARGNWTHEHPQRTESTVEYIVVGVSIDDMYQIVWRVEQTIQDSVVFVGEAERLEMIGYEVEETIPLSDHVGKARLSHERVENGVEEESDLSIDHLVGFSAGRLCSRASIRRTTARKGENRDVRIAVGRIGELLESVEWSAR